MSDRDNGLFVTLEGIDGSGKTTAADAIEREFKSVVRTQEPSDLWTGKQVRRAISNDSDTHPLTTFFLFMADRTYHINERITPALDRDMMVVSDRYSDSTLAYQPVALEDHINDPKAWMELVMEQWNLEPDLTIYLDVSVDTAIERSAGDEEYEDREFLRQVKMNYGQIREMFSHRYEVVDGDQPIEDVRAEVVELIRSER
jgi:dTMP kinase